MKKLFIVNLILLCGVIFYSCESNDNPVINNTPVTNAPTLISPDNNSVSSNLIPSFDWSDVVNATNYRLQISKNSSFINIVVDTILASSQFNPSTNILKDSLIYFWRVRGFRGTDSTDWSSANYFMTFLNPINATNKVLIEIFTNTSCVPCVEANQYLDAIHILGGVTINNNAVVISRIHTTLFQGDPFYLYNTTDNNARMNFYPNSAIVNPRTYLLGIFMGNYSSSVWTNKINEKLGDTRTFAIVIVNSYDSVSRNGNLSFIIKQISGTTYNDIVYHVAVLENNIQYAAPNGETHFENTFRDFITPPDGQGFTLNSVLTNSYFQNYTIASAINQNNTDLVVFVQRTSNRDVLAVEKVKLK